MARAFSVRNQMLILTKFPSFARSQKPLRLRGLPRLTEPFFHQSSITYEPYPTACSVLAKLRMRRGHRVPDNHAPSPPGGYEECGGLSSYHTAVKGLYYIHGRTPAFTSSDGQILRSLGVGRAGPRLPLATDPERHEARKNALSPNAQRGERSVPASRRRIGRAMPVEFVQRWRCSTARYSCG